ncbi:MAG: peptidase MA family metallohydrolase, partial [Dehalococcoidia bacterium]|nr:peptidase MA family metallohydrolase [Dehalococcoidia bacterium]
EVRLVYQVAPDGVRTSAVPDCTEGAVTSCRFLLEASERNVIIPGAEVTWFWQLTGAGMTEETEPAVVVYEDSRFQWSTITESNLTIWYYSGSEDEVRAVLAAARESLDSISALLQVSVDFPVKIRYYASALEMQPAILAEDRDNVITLGEVVYSDTAMVAADSAPDEIARHEIAHIVTREAVESPFALPDWLNEGTAVFAQSEPLGGQGEALDLAIQTGDVFSVRSLSSASTGALGETVSLFYGQSWSLVDFLVTTYGEAQFAELFGAFRDGANTEEALEQVYGFNQDGLENAWRESVGLPPRLAPTPAGDGERVPPEDAQDASGAAADNGDGASVVLIVAIIALTVVLAGGAVGTAVFLARRYR